MTSRKSEESFTVGGENNKKKLNEITDQVVLGLSRHEFLKVLDSINIGLASKELVTLLNMYKVLVYFEEEEDIKSETFLDATLMKVDIENSLRLEIIKGYEFYHNKLNLEEITSSGFYEVKNDNIEFNYKIDQKKKENLKKEIEENAKKYLD